MRSPDEITQLLLNWSNGDRQAFDHLVPLVYDELRGLASRHLSHERIGHTLSTTALVHEAYFRLVDIDRVAWQDRAHFLAMASRVMRRVLIDHARSRTRKKRGGGAERVDLDEELLVSEQRAAELIALDAALEGLAELNERQSRIVEMRFFGGLTIEETGHVLELSPASIKRDWLAARAWLNCRLAPEEAGEV